jgi:hypothetical protein
MPADCRAARRYRGRVDLMVTSPPYACEAGVIDKPGWRAGHLLCPRNTLNYSHDPANLGHARSQTWRSGIAEVLAGSRGNRET